MEDYKVSGVVQSGEQSQEDSRSQRGRRKPAWMEDYDVSGVVQSGEQSDDVFFSIMFFYQIVILSHLKKLLKSQNGKKPWTRRSCQLKETIAGN
jgi:hypothetical protein